MKYPRTLKRLFFFFKLSIIKKKQKKQGMRHKKKKCFEQHAHHRSKPAKYTEHDESPNHWMIPAFLCQIFFSTVSDARLLLVSLLRGELIAKPGCFFSLSYPWNQRNKRKMVHWWIMCGLIGLKWILPVLTKEFSPSELVSVCPEWQLIVLENRPCGDRSIDLN